MTQAARYNSGHSLEAFATRVRMLRQHPEVWRQAPAGATPRQWKEDPALRQLWQEVAVFLMDCGLLSVHTAPRDLNVPKLLDAVRKVEDGHA